MKINMSHVNVAHIENNRVTTNSKTLKAIAIASGIRPG